jgi:ABC-2 type transport system ATP-binding protein
MAVAVDISGLRKTYLRRRPRPPALTDVHMRIDTGHVHGFLGPNGAGKTTTLRALLGLVSTDAGRMQLFGYDVPTDLREIAGSIGAVVEGAQFAGWLTGRQALTILATAGGVPTVRVGQVLEEVDLADRARDRIRTYSLGMRQRLAVASALLKQPRLLIMDEPANGLDPAGIRHMRDLMRRLADTGVTVLFSSHLLSEVAQVCDAVTVIADGRTVAQGPIAQVFAGHTTGGVRVALEHHADHPAAARLLRDVGHEVLEHDDHLLITGDVSPAQIGGALYAREYRPVDLTQVAPNLEEVFLQLTGLPQDRESLPDNAGASASPATGDEVSER